MARLKGVSDEEASFVTRSVFRAAAKKTGKVPDPLRILARNSGVMWAAGGFEMGWGRARSVPPSLKSLASLKAASMIGCLF